MSAERPTWMIYGAYGFTGQHIAREAVKRGHRPLLAGRSAKKLRALAAELGLNYRAFSLDDPAALAGALRDVDLVLHCAGPFAETAAPMRLACLESHTNYLDITGELPVFAGTFDLDAEARRHSLLLMSGVGFDVVPSDCLARYVSRHVRSADHLEIAVTTNASPTGGTARSALGMLPGVGLVRRDHALTRVNPREAVREIPLPSGAVRAIPAPLPDLVSAYHSTYIPNITTYLVYSFRRGAPPPGVLLALAEVLAISPVRWLAQKLAGLLARGPSPEGMQRGRSLVWAKVSREDGACFEAWLETPEPYRLTAVAAVRAVERVLAERPIGALTPSQAFGEDFVLEVDGTRRYDEMP
ncbi:MAG TPA: saccharopine dehydrogenase NADP-binding domain-containing protein [Aggregatilineales bacterium]|nr:saccharopine dehydrogenase NADP-binding domain-containing protein [Aggregatilineales bacterium]HQE17786.1 saccharopine dehydrogenase NADP-binding domain-containing protein [Aggregatilineales bacterium]